MKYVSVDDLVSFALNDESLWLYPKEPMDLRPFIEHAIKFGGVRAVEEEDDTGALKKLEERITTLEAEMRMQKHLQCSFYGKGDIKRHPYHIIFETRKDAEKVLEKMRALLVKRGVLTIADYYFLADQTLQGEADYYFGWTKLDTVSIYSYYEKGGKRVWSLKLPEPLPIQYC